MDFFFSHDGQVFHLHTETGEAECDQVDKREPEQQSLEPSGDDE